MLACSIGGPLLRVDAEVVIGKAWGPTRIQLCNPDGSPLDLSGCSLSCAVMSGDTVIAAVDVTVFDADNGLIDILLPEGQSALLAGYRLAFDWGLEITDAQGRKVQAWIGKMRAIRGVPRD